MVRYCTKSCYGHPMTKTPNADRIARRVSARLAESDLSQAGLARASGIPLSTLRRKLAGHGSLTIDELEALGLPLGRGLASWFDDLPTIVGNTSKLVA